jgi:glycosyltransferase involved in cell wall biosynthesis
MRILHISSAKTFSGTERQMVDLCRGLTERGHEVFVALRPTNEWESRLDFIAPGNFLHTSIRNSFGMFSAKRIGRFLVDSKIDVIHAHLARDYIAAAISSRMSENTRFVLTRHMMGAMKPFHKFALRNVDAAIAVSKAVGLQLEGTFPREKIHVILNGLRLDPTEHEKVLRDGFRRFHSIPLDAPVVGTMGELKPSKGQRDFVLAANEVAKTSPDCRFIIAGKDNTADQRHRRELRRMVKVFGLNDKFVWLDWLDDTAPFFASLDIFVSPSHTESFGLAILEAMVRGKAVVASNTDGAKELLGDIGLLVPINAAVELAKSIDNLLSDEESRVAVGRELSRSALDRFSLDKMADETATLYNGLVNAANKRA